MIHPSSVAVLREHRRAKTDRVKEAVIAEGRTDDLRGPHPRKGGDQRRDAGITTPVLVPLSPDGSQLNGLKAVFAVFEQ